MQAQAPPVADVLWWIPAFHWRRSHRWQLEACCITLASHRTSRFPWAGNTAKRMSELRLREHAYRGRMTSGMSRPRRSMIFRVEHVLEVFRMVADIGGSLGVLRFWTKEFQELGVGVLILWLLETFILLILQYLQSRSFDTGYFLIRDFP